MDERAPTPEQLLRRADWCAGCGQKVPNGTGLIAVLYRGKVLWFHLACARRFEAWEARKDVT